MSNALEIPKAYSAADHESEIYSNWEKSGAFKPSGEGETFSITMPPPNTTGVLHLGHASALAYEDLMTRYKRLRGYRTVYIPGTDHAAIATQNKVERIIEEEGTSRQKLGREAFLDRVREYVAQSQGTIKSQIRSLGASCDWDREAYTFDEVSSRVVNEVFIKMFNDGLIYRGNRIVNWCTRCNSVLADDEVEYREEQTPFYYFKYGPVVIGTARPETKFRDKTIIVHPDDTRYQELIGKKFDVEWIDGKVAAEVIADEIADPELGTGAMTITPAHSFEDFDLAKKYDLPIEQIIGTDGTLTEAAGSMAGMPVEEARKQVVEILQKKGLVDHIDEKYVHNLSVCYRCGTAVQPLISDQWFVDVNKKIPNRGKSLKQLATELVARGDIEIIPERFRKVYFNWMNNLHDWCISRQIWWGHRIPIWYGKNDEDVVASVDSPGEQYTQDEDTLDTWFSSATWTFSTLLNRDHEQFNDLQSWIEGSPDMQDFHPTSVLETGYDIIFFWVARMVLITAYVVEEKPFDQVYLHGMVRDKEGRKMSKSLGNGIDPNEMIEKYGADALRLSLIIGSAPGQDLRLYDEKIAGYRNFVNKLWNISRFILQSVDSIESIPNRPQPKTTTDTWILSRFDQTIESMTQALDTWQFSQAGEALYSFTWNELADWYLEIVKVESARSTGDKEEKDRILLFMLERLLILWHPFAPFVTEVIAQSFNRKEFIMQADWPVPSGVVDSATVTRFTEVQEAITYIRTIRAEHSIPAQQTLNIAITAGWASTYRDVIERLARCEFVDSVSGGHEYETTTFKLSIDLAVEMSEAKKKELDEYITTLEAKLANVSFTKNAPSEIVEQERQKLEDAKKKRGV